MERIFVDAEYAMVEIYGTISHPSLSRTLPWQVCPVSRLFLWLLGNAWVELSD
jgi:hypothetical protein